MRALVVVLLGAVPLVACDFILADAPRDQDIIQEPVTPPADELEARLRERGREVAPYMVLAGEAMRGEAEEGDSRDFSQMVYHGWCYQLIALGGEGIEDLDMRIYDDNDVLLQRDTTRDAQPYIGRMRPICPAVSATYRIQIRVVSGSGQFVAQVYRSI